MKTKRQARRNKPRGKKQTPAGQVLSSKAIRFPEVNGKTLEWVELWIEDDDESYIELRFQDQTGLLFVVEPQASLNLHADYGRWKSENWRRIKEWPPFGTG
jgi:spore coat protein CotH